MLISEPDYSYMNMSLLLLEKEADRQNDYESDGERLRETETHRRENVKRVSLKKKEGN